MNDRNDKNRSRQSKDARNPQFRPRKKPVKAASGKPSPTAKHPKPPRASARQRSASPRRPAKKPDARRRLTGRKRLLRVALLGLLTLITLTVIAGGVTYASILRDLPDPGDPLKGRDQTSVIYDRNGEVLAKLFAEQNRTDVPFADIPQDLKDAVLATEDQRFFEHEGVDPRGILRALWVTLTSDEVQGGSTITQQYVKNALITPERTLRRKLMEAVLAYQIESRFTKEEILELYLNTIYFGHRAYGIESAAQVFFGKPATELGLAESAMLAGVIRSPGRYSPYLNPEDANNRRSTVLRQMLDQGRIDNAEFEAAQAQPIETAGLPDNDAQAPYFVEYIKAQITERYGSELVFRGGIRIDTTLDMRLQRAAEAAVANHLQQPDGPSAALVAVDPSTGEILAMVGGKDFETKQFNVAVQGRRQPGSVFKTFVLAAALQEGVGTEQVFESGPASLQLPNGETWDVTGAAPGGPMRLREATEKSVNSIFAELILDIGAEEVLDTAKRMGIVQETQPVPAIALGGLDVGVSPLEMAASYIPLAAGGTSAVPFGLKHVSDAEGEALFSAEPSRTAAISPQVAYLTTDILKGVLTRGTGTAARIGRPAAGKTGTTQEYRDAWFVGYTPQIVCAVWVGHPEAAREMKDSRGRNITGGSIPSRIWADFMKAAHEPLEVKEFSRPEGVSQISICSDTGQRAGQWCPNSFTSLYLAEHLPDECGQHTGPVQVEIPELIGMTKENAISALRRALLPFEVVEQDVRGVPAGIVSSQNPQGRSIGTTATVVTIVVSDGGRSDRPPVARFTSPAEGAIGQAVTFDAALSSDDGTITSFQWEFGDGQKLTGRQVTHTYAAPGSYSVTLWVTDNRNQTTSTTRNITIR